MVFFKGAEELAAKLPILPIIPQTQTRLQRLNFKIWVSDVMAAPKGLISFDKLDVCQPYKQQLVIAILSSLSLIILGLFITSLKSLNIVFFIPFLALSALILAAFGYDILAVIYAPIAVNLNHPFVDEEPIGEAEVHVRFSNSVWQKLGKHRVRLVKDEMIGGFNLVEDFGEYKLIGHYTKSSNKKRCAKQVIIINQALGLRDMVNGDIDPIESARKRENMDYGLLERDWLEEEELSIEGPLSKFINKEEA